MSPLSHHKYLCLATGLAKSLVLLWSLNKASCGTPLSNASVPGGLASLVPKCICWTLIDVKFISLGCKACTLIGPDDAFKFKGAVFAGTKFKGNDPKFVDPTGCASLWC